MLKKGYHEEQVEKRIEGKNNFIKLKITPLQMSEHHHYLGKGLTSSGLLTSRSLGITLFLVCSGNLGVGLGL
jgi:hypothetical protein